MPKITAASIALTALAALVLTGCAGTAEPAADGAQETPQATVSETPTPEPEPTVESKPMVVEDTGWVPPTKDELQSVWYGKFGNAVQAAGFEFPYLEDSLPVGQYICDQYRAGAAPESIVAIEGLSEANAYINTQVVDYTLMNGYELTTEQTERGEQLPDYCGVLFPAS